MQRTKAYDRVLFRATSLERIVSEFKNIVAEPGKSEFRSLAIDNGKESWRYDTFDEFLAEINGNFRYARLYIYHPELSLEMLMYAPGPGYSNPTTVDITSSRRETIMRLSNVVDSSAEDCYVPPPPESETPPVKPKIFIGHGGSPQWRDLKDHLRDLHGYEVVAYETGSRAGHTISAET